MKQRTRIIALVLSALLCLSLSPAFAVASEEPAESDTETDVVFEPEAPDEPETADGVETPDEPEAAHGTETPDEPETADGTETPDEPEAADGADASGEQPVSEEDGEPLPAGDGDGESGVFGDTLVWSLADGVLTVAGTGDMPNLGYYTDAPWSNSRNRITGLVIDKGVTGVGANCFSYCTALTEISLPDTLKRIGEMAFYNCTALREIVLPDSLTDLGGSCFYNCPSAAVLSFGKGLTNIGDTAFSNCAA